MRKYTLILLFFFYSGYTQEHEWVKSLTPVSGSNLRLQTTALTLDSLNNTYVTGQFLGDFTIENDTFLYKNASPQNSLIARFDKDGNFKWIKTLHVYVRNSTFNVTSYPVISNVNNISNNQTLIHGHYRIGDGKTVLKLSPDDSIVNSIGYDPNNSQNHVGFIAIYDSLGNIIKVQKIYEGIIQTSMWNGQINIDNDKNIYVNVMAYSGTLYSGSSNKNINYSTWNRLLIKYSPNFNDIVWYTNIAEVSSPSSFIISRICVGKEDQNIYIASIIDQFGNNTVKIDGEDFLKYIPNGIKKGFLIIVSESGNFIHKGFINSDSTQTDNITDIIAFDTSRIYITGQVEDSIYYGDEWFSSLGNSTTGIAHPYIAKINPSKADWIKFAANKHENPVSNSDFFITVSDSRIISDEKGFVYCSFRYFKDFLSFGDLSDSAKSTRGFVKLDSRGNTLWLRKGVETIDMQTDRNSDLVFCGEYVNQLDLPPYTLSSTNTSGFVAKITDYYIDRGDISSGPYCAGDTLFVPYVQQGNYDTSNYFIAELSDEYGNFDGREKELGRLKSIKDSTIIGQLPLFQVISSEQYRIRVRSTSPPVQSYYRYDTLRLLIYSRDKADPGLTESICKGDTIQLNTFGGTAWQWSPAYRMNDSSLRQPKVRPDSTFTYRIVIGDSSGCGAPDTAFKTIVVRKPPQVEIHSPDTMVCMNSEIELSADFDQGDSSRYFWLWFAINKSNSPVLVKGWSNDSTNSWYGGFAKYKDTINYQIPANQTDSQRMMLVIRDYCSQKTDTGFYTVYINQEEPLVLLNQGDTAICPGTEISLNTNFTGGQQSGYEWTWYDTDSNIVHSDSGKTADTLIINPTFNEQNPLNYFLVLQDNCSPRQDTVYADIYPREALEVLANITDTLLCAGQQITFSATATGGVPENYQYRWEDQNRNIISQEDTLSIIADNTEEYILILSDACMPKEDTTQVILRVNPPLEADILKDGNPGTDTTICYGSELTFLAEGYGGDSAGYDFSWYLDDNLISTDSNLSLQFEEAGNRSIQLVLRDNCTSLSDTQSIQIDVLPALEVSAVIPDTLCRGEQIALTAQASGGLSDDYQYEWRWEDESLGNTETISLNLAEPSGNSGILQLILSDLCSDPNDTFVKEIFFRAVLELAISANDTCADPNALLSANVEGGYALQHRIRWYDEANNLLGEGFSLNVSPQGVQSYSAILDDACSDKPDTAIISIGSVPDIILSVNPDEGCEPLPITFTLQTNYPESYSWNLDPGNGNTQSNLTEDQITLTLSARSYSASASISTDFGCSNQIENISYTVFPKPQAYFTFKPENPSLDTLISFQNLSIGATNYYWDIQSHGRFQDFEPKIAYSDTGTYLISLIVESNEGCADTFSSTLRVTPQYHVFLPNAFSPDGNGRNDHYRPIVSGVEEISFQIFNRWGELIFSGKDHDSWDGTYLNKACQPGIYVVIVKSKGIDNTQRTDKATVLLLR